MVTQTRNELYTGCLAEIVSGDFDGCICHVVSVVGDNVEVDIYNPDGDNFIEIVPLKVLKLKYG